MCRHSLISFSRPTDPSNLQTSFPRREATRWQRNLGFPTMRRALLPSSESKMFLTMPSELPSSLVVTCSSGSLTWKRSRGPFSRHPSCLRVRLAPLWASQTPLPRTARALIPFSAIRCVQMSSSFCRAVPLASLHTKSIWLLPAPSSMTSSPSILVDRVWGLEGRNRRTRKTWRVGRRMSRAGGEPRSKLGALRAWTLIKTGRTEECGAWIDPRCSSRALWGLPRAIMPSPPELCTLWVHWGLGEHFLDGEGGSWVCAWSMLMIQWLDDHDSWLL